MMKMKTQENLRVAQAGFILLARRPQLLHLHPTDLSFARAKEEEHDDVENKECMPRSWDGITGEELDSKVYDKVPTKDCWDKTGKAPIQTRWIDISKGDKKNSDQDLSRKISTRAKELICLLQRNRWKL